MTILEDKVVVAAVGAVAVVVVAAGGAVLGGDAAGFDVLVSGLLKLKEEEVIGRSVGDVGDEEGTTLMMGEAGTDVAGIDLAGEPGAVDGVGDFGTGC